MAQFLDFYNETNGTHFAVDSEPDPPEAIIRDGDEFSWLEVATCYWRPDPAFSDSADVNSAQDHKVNEYARDLYSFATPGETYMPVKFQAHMGLDDRFADEFSYILKNKLSKSSYAPFRERYGSGILLISVEHPFYDVDDDTTIEFISADRLGISSLGYFGRVFILRRSYIREWIL